MRVSRLAAISPAFDGFQGLVADAVGTAVPEKFVFPCEVVEGHGIAETDAAVDTNAYGFGLGKSVGFEVAGGAAGLVVGGKVGVVEEFFAEGDVLGSGGSRWGVWGWGTLF